MGTFVLYNATTEQLQWKDHTDQTDAMVKRTQTRPFCVEVITATYKEYLGKGHVDFPLGIYIEKGRTRSCGDVKKQEKTKRQQPSD